MSILDALIQEGRDDVNRPWWQRSSGGVLVAVVFLVLASQILISALFE